MDDILITVGVIVAFASIAYSVLRYMKTDTTKFMTAFENSASVALSRIVTTIGGIWTAVVHYVQTNADVLGSKNFSGLIQFMFDQKAAGLALLAIGVVLDIVHNREVQKLPPGSPSNNG